MCSRWRAAAFFAVAAGRRLLPGLWLDHRLRWREIVLREVQHGAAPGGEFPVRLGAVRFKPADHGDFCQSLQARLRRRLRFGGQQMRVGRNGHRLGRVGVRRLRVWPKRVLRVLQLRGRAAIVRVRQHELDAIDVGAAGLHIEIDEAEQGPLGLPHHLGAAALGHAATLVGHRHRAAAAPFAAPHVARAGQVRQRIVRIDHPRRPRRRRGLFPTRLSTTAWRWTVERA